LREKKWIALCFMAKAVRGSGGGERCAGSNKQFETKQREQDEAAAAVLISIPFESWKETRREKIIQK
jgi:hypothetical protein